jgi:hypothetical protein
MKALFSSMKRLVPCPTTIEKIEVMLLIRYVLGEAFLMATPAWK